LEADLVSANDDVFKLRDVLLQACRILHKPRCTRGGSGDTMTEENKLKLKENSQGRLRVLIIACLEKLWQSDCGEELLRLALDKVQALVTEFETKESADVDGAIAGQQWVRLKDLADKIEGKLGPRAKCEGRSVKHDSAGIIKVCELAITALGGRATTAQIREWIESHPETIAEHPEIKLNAEPSASNRCLSRGTKWMVSVSGRLTDNFKSIKEGRLLVWTLERVKTVQPKRVAPPELQGQRTKATRRTKVPVKEGDVAKINVEDKRLHAHAIPRSD